MKPGATISHIVTLLSPCYFPAFIIRFDSQRLVISFKTTHRMFPPMRFRKFHITFFLSISLAFVVHAEDVTELEAIVITEDASTANHIEPTYQEIKKEVDKTPGGVTVIKLDEATEGEVSTLADMLRYVPGVWAVSDTGNEDVFFSSRGSNLDATDFDMNGIKLLQDGLPVTTAAGDNHNRIIDPLSAKYAILHAAPTRRNMEPVLWEVQLILFHPQPTTRHHWNFL